MLVYQEIHILLIQYGIIVAFIYFCLFIIRFYRRNSREFEKDYQLSGGEYDWLIWPAVGMNRLFRLLFGEPGNRFLSLFNARSALVTLGFSLAANSLCVYVILTNAPPDFPKVDLPFIRFIVANYFFFLLFNFFGDWVSVNITRYALSRIVQKRFKLFKYIAMDASGIFVGYAITLLPSYAIFLYCLITDTPLNPWLRAGFLGNAIIPFYLGIFAYSNITWAFPVLVAFAVFSVTIPTAFYIILILLFYIHYKLIRRKDESVQKRERNLPVTPSENFDIFISYSREDQHWLKQMETQFGPLKHNKVAYWYDQMMGEARQYKPEIAEKIKTTKLALLILTPNFFHSKYILKNEMPLFEKYNIPLLPILVEPCGWKNVPAIAKYTIFPEDETPLSEKSEVEKNNDLLQLPNRILNVAAHIREADMIGKKRNNIDSLVDTLYNSFKTACIVLVGLVFIVDAILIMR